MCGVCVLHDIYRADSLLFGRVGGKPGERNGHVLSNKMYVTVCLDLEGVHEEAGDCDRPEFFSTNSPLVKQ